VYSTILVDKGLVDEKVVKNSIFLAVTKVIGKSLICMIYSVGAALVSELSLSSCAAGEATTRGAQDTRGI
jgi:hypothetical protein